MKKIITIFCSIIFICFSFAVNASAYENVKEESSIVSLHDDNIVSTIDSGNGVACIITEEESNDINIIATNRMLLSTNGDSQKQYTSKTYNGSYYYPNTGETFSHFSFTAYFSYDGNIVNCYKVEENHYWDGNCSNYSSYLQCLGTSKKSISPTLACGSVKYCSYNENNNEPNHSVEIQIYCDQNGAIHVFRL